MKLTDAAQANVDETGTDPQDDVAAIRSGQYTRESLLAHCLDGADPDRKQGWHEYVDTICERAARP